MIVNCLSERSSSAANPTDSFTRSVLGRPLTTTFKAKLSMVVGLKTAISEGSTVTSRCSLLGMILK